MYHPHITELSFNYYGCYHYYVNNCCLYVLVCAGARKGRAGLLRGSVGWHYLSNATCLMRPHLFCVLFTVSRIIMI